MSCAFRRPPRGFTLVELIVALLVVSWIGAATLRAYAVLRTAGERTAAVSSATHAQRVLRSVLRAELGTGAPGVDWAAHAPDSIRLRAFRATAIPCGPPVDSTLVVGVRGVRALDPSKDSVLVLTVDGRWEVAAVVGRVAGECDSRDMPFWSTSPTEVERWTLRPMPVAPVLLRVFETGSYHLADGVLRYRRGAGGRQPLTEAVLTSARFADSVGVVSADTDPARALPSRAVLARRR